MTGVVGRARGGLVALRANPVFGNAASLFGSTAVTSGLGFAYWFVAAHLFPIHGVGVASAAVSAMQLLATFGILGMGTLMIGELAGRRFPKGLVSAALVFASFVCALTGIAFLALQPVLSTKMGPLGEGLAGPAIFVAGVAATGATMVLDQACIGLHRGDLQLSRNTVFSAVKLALVPLGVAAADNKAALVIYASWLLGNVVSLATFLFHARRTGVEPHLPPAFRALAAIRGAAFAHHWLNLAAQAPRLVLPVLVAATLSPELNAAFYTAMLIVTFAALIPVHLSTALFALPKGDEARLAKELRSTLRVSWYVAGGSALLFAVLAEPLLSLFGHEYTVASTSMATLGLTTAPFVVKVHYAAVCRVQNRLKWCAAVSTAGGLLEVALCYAGARAWGLNGVSLGLLAGLTVEAAFLWPAVGRAARLRPLALPGWSRA